MEDLRYPIGQFEHDDDVRQPRFIPVLDSIPIQVLPDQIADLPGGEPLTTGHCEVSEVMRRIDGQDERVNAIRRTMKGVSGRQVRDADLVLVRDNADEKRIVAV